MNNNLKATQMTSLSMLMDEIYLDNYMVNPTELFPREVLTSLASDFVNKDLDLISAISWAEQCLSDFVLVYDKECRHGWRIGQDSAIVAEQKAARMIAEGQA